MNKRLVRIILMFAVLMATAGVFTYYYLHHPEVKQQLSRTSPASLIAILILYIGFMLSLAVVTAATLRLCNIKADMRETGLLTIYTAVVNFFGPLQSGPAFRAVYLKKRYDVNLKAYAKATLAYYIFYAAFCVLFLVSGLIKWWSVPLVIAGVALAVWLSRHRSYLPAGWRELQLQNWYLLAIATFMQLVFTALIFHIELQSVVPATSLGQAVIYAGAGSLALFVSITPAAIGFRESFQLFAQSLDHIGSSTIISANIIDRAAYVVLLAILAVLVFGTHANRLLRKQIDR